MRATGRRGGAGPCARIRPRLRRRDRAVRAVPRRLGARRARDGVHEPRRPGDPAAAWVSRGGVQRGRAVRGDRRRQPAVLRHHVPPRGGAHAARCRAAAQLRPRRGGVRRRLDHGRLSRRRDRPAAPSGRHRPGDLRIVGRGRQRGGRRADPRGDRRSADLHLRRPRPAAHRRGRPGHRGRFATDSTSAWCIAMRPTCS